MKPSFRPTLSQLQFVLVLALSVSARGVAAEQDAPDMQSVGPLVVASNHKAQTPQRDSAPPAPTAAQTVAALPPAPVYDETIFGDRIPAVQLAFLKGFDRSRTHDLYHDKQFKVVKQAVLPKWEFHYGHDMSVTSAMDAALDDSKDAVQVRDGRYVMLSGASTLYPGLQGRGFIWVDMQEGITLAGFYFHPTNGEPTPTTTVFSKQLMVDAISMAQLPPEFFQDYSQWNADERLSPVMTRYFIGGLNKRLLLEHDENFCSATFAGLGTDCLQMTADAADLDMNTAYYLDQVNYATNATAYMLVGSDQTAFLRLRANRCGAVTDPLGCRILITRQQIHTISRPVTVRRR